ncbi:hypothetical protein Hanom_Chr16g01420651 [Helianthus anomalus]
MDWRTTSNVIDCGIFCNEEYGNWLVGQVAKEDAPNQLQQRQLNDLMMKYIAKILMRSENENRR